MSVELEVSRPIAVTASIRYLTVARLSPNLDQNEFCGEQLTSLGSQLLLPMDGSFMPLVTRVDESINVSGIKEDRCSLVGHARNSRGSQLGR
jgi:hypothetical protein